MIKVAICDDEIFYLDTYLKMINRMKTKYSIEVHRFNSGEDLINYMVINEIQFDLVFLDIIMGELNGIETAKKIKQINETTEIVFLTSSKEYALDGYEIRAFNYIIKNSQNVEERIYAAIKYTCAKSNDYILINNKSSIEKIEINKIIYIESNKRKIKIKTIDSEYEMYEKLDNVYEKIKKFGFMKSHRSYIINMHYIKKIEVKDITTTMGDIIPISRGKVDEVKNNFINYLETLS